MYPESPAENPLPIETPTDEATATERAQDRGAPRDAVELSFSESLARLCRLPPASLRAIAGATVPIPYSDLLVHERDMTSTLEAFHNEILRLEVLHLERRGELMIRQVLLVGERTGAARELGAIRIHLQHFATAPRDEILAAKIPLGSILARHSVPYQSRPSAFHSVRASDELIQLLPTTAADSTLFGRSNRLLDPGSGQPLAEVLEILPPAEPAE